MWHGAIRAVVIFAAAALAAAAIGPVTAGAQSHDELARRSNWGFDRGIGSLSPELGGATTRPLGNRMAFSQPAANLSRDRVRAFFFGNRLFNTNWVAAPASVDAFDGLGPLFNRVSCSGCHLRDGRGAPPGRPEEPLLSALVRISLPGRDAHGGPRPHPAYGDQISDRALPGLAAEARPVITWTETAGSYADGEAYSLRNPSVALEDPAYGPLGDDLMTSFRVAPAVIGLGLLEAVPEATIVALADPEDADGDGVSGRANRVWDTAARELRLGRFGWKASQPSLRQQNAGAAVGDIGITTPLFPLESCSAHQAACQAATSGGVPEMSELFLDKLTLYTQSLAVPLQRHAEDPQVARGATLFEAAGCTGCHVPTLATGAATDRPHLAGQVFHPFTDLLLHDMGEGLADGRPDFEAGGREWRTPPLWGLGLIETVSGHNRLLHDGRARGPAEAILWHGGEAAAAREAFRAMPRTDRDALIRFLGSL